MIQDKILETKLGAQGLGPVLYCGAWIRKFGLKMVGKFDITKKAKNRLQMQDSRQELELSTQILRNILTITF